MENQKSNLIRCAGCVLLLATLNLQLSAAPLGTAFTYQGKLVSGGNAANGIYDFTFAVWNAASGGAQQGAAFATNAVPVTNGYFVVTLDFGPGVFPGDSRWLEISVKTNSVVGYTTLAPRQQLTPSPYAIMAASASNLLGTLPAAQLTGTVGNGQLASSSVTVSAGTGLSGGGAVALGGSTTLNNAGVLSLTGNADITVSSASGNVTLGDTATSANTASAIVKRDASGNFSAATITGNLAGNATTANSFTGPLAGDVTGAQATTVVSSLGGQSAANVAAGASAANAATAANTPGTIVQRDGSGNFSAGAITAASLSGDGSGLINLNGANLVNGSVGNAQLATYAVQTANIAAGAVGSGQLASGAAASNLLAGGQSPVPSGSLILCASNNAAALQNSGYIQIAPVCFGDVWQPIPSAGAPSARIDHLAVWTGREMLVWGGYDGTKWHQDGARYNPFTGTWSSMSTTGSPLAAAFAVWTGHEMLVFGGAANAPGRYNPTNDTWTHMSTNGVPTNGFYYGSAVWTGAEMILWGGLTGSTANNTGGRYNPVTDTWAAISTNGAPSARYNHTAIWTGTEMVIWGGYNGSIYLNSGARYNPVTDTWTNVTLVGAPSAREGNVAVWTGTEMIVWGGTDGTYPTTGGRYNPATDTWRATSTVGVPAGRFWWFNLSNVAVWTGTEMVFWSGYGSAGVLNSGGRYNPNTDVWTAMTVVGAPSARVRSTTVWADTGMTVFGGWNGSSYPAYGDAFTYVPSRSLFLYQRP